MDTIRLSQPVPWRRAASSPTGMPIPRVMMMAARLSCMDTRMRVPITSRTDLPRNLKLSPKSSRVITPSMYLAYWIKRGSSKPNLARMRSRTSSFWCCPNQICTGSPGPSRSMAKVMKVTMITRNGSQISLLIT